MIKEKKMVKLAKCYEDGSGERISIEINQKEKKEFQVKIKDVWMSMEDLRWLQEAISEAISFINKGEEK